MYPRTSIKEIRANETRSEWKLTSFQGWRPPLYPAFQDFWTGLSSQPFWPPPPCGGPALCHDVRPGGLVGGCRCWWPYCHWHQSPESWRNRWCESRWTAESFLRERGRWAQETGSAAPHPSWSRSLLGRGDPRGLEVQSQGAVGCSSLHCPHSQSLHRSWDQQTPRPLKYNKWLQMRMCTLTKFHMGFYSKEASPYIWVCVFSKKGFVFNNKNLILPVDQYSTITLL